MKEPITINLYDMRGKGWKSWLFFAQHLAFLAFCIWLSQGSTWWTFVTGCLFLLVFFSRVASLVKSSEMNFHSLDELQVWLDRQKLIESLPRGEIIIDHAEQEQHRQKALRE